MAKAARKTKAAEASSAASVSPASPPLGPLDGRAFTRAGIELSPLPFCERISLRAGEGTMPALSNLFGVKLPTRPKSSAAGNGVTALWLGPDEWLLFAEAGRNLAATPAPDDAGFASIVDISHRNVAIRIAGPKAAIVLASGCPQDLSLAAFPVAACSRTIIGKSEIVLLRTGPSEFRLECWRSFADYVWKFLEDAARSV
jgi:sarcosine oxidase subunit gamma